MPRRDPASERAADLKAALLMLGLLMAWWTVYYCGLGPQ